MAEVEIAAPRRSCEVVSDAERPWILPEPWKTPGSPEIDGIVVVAFSAAPWTGFARPQDPQARRRPHSLEAKVMYDPPNWGR